MGDMKSVTVVIPARNEAATIGKLLDDLKEVTSSLNEYSFEIIVVDDKSTDQTARIAQDKGARVVHNKGKNGKGKSLICGFEQARFDILVMMDADYSHRAEDLPALLTALKDNVGLVVGSRIYGGSDEFTRIRALGNIALTLVFGMLHGRYLSDALNGYKVFRREVFSKYKYHARDFEIEIELLCNTIRSGLDIVEVPSHERARAGGEAKSKVILHGTKFLFMIIRKWFEKW